MRPLFREYIQIFEWNHHSLYVAKQGRESQAEKHDEEENRPDRRSRHLGYCLCEDDEGQAGSLHSLQLHRLETKHIRVRKVNNLNTLIQCIHRRSHLTEKCLHVTSFNVQSKNSLRRGAVELIEGRLVVARSDVVLRKVKCI